MDQGIAGGIRSSTIDGRAITPRFRQRQLAALQSSLVQSRNEILSAITNDTRHTRSEAEAQYYLALQALKTIYLTLDPLKMIEEEYSLAHSQSNLCKHTPYGCAYIVPSTKSPFYSAVIAMAAAIAAGNCVVLELQHEVSELTSLLRKILPAALNPLTFAAVDEDVFDEGFKKRFCIVLDGRQKENAVTTTRTIATPESRVAAVVDRSANLQEAARECVRARFAFSGESAYAPDVVLVNEFKLKEFCSVVAEAALSYLTANLDAHGKHACKSFVGPSRELQQQLDDASVTVVASGSRGTVALIPSLSHSSKILMGKISEPVLLIHPVTSLDNAIDLLNSSSSQPLLAAHIFAGPEPAKYLSQFITASTSFVNGIPAELLVGPPAPVGFPISIISRYTPEMFATTQPEHFIYSSDLSADVRSLLDGAGKKKLEKLHKISLPVIKEKVGPPIGFFEQGLLVGLSVALVTIVASITVTFTYIYPAVLKRVRT